MQNFGSEQSGDMAPAQALTKTGRKVRRRNRTKVPIITVRPTTGHGATVLANVTAGTLLTEDGSNYGIVERLAEGVIGIRPIQALDAIRFLFNDQGYVRIASKSLREELGIGKHPCVWNDAEGRLEITSIRSAGKRPSSSRADLRCAKEGFPSE